MALFRFLVVCSVVIYISCSVIKNDSIKETDNSEDTGKDTDTDTGTGIDTDTDTGTGLDTDTGIGIDTDTDMIPDEPEWNIKKACFESKIFNARSNKIICLICTGFDPSCFESKTNSTSTGSPTTPAESMISEASAEE